MKHLRNIIYPDTKLENYIQLFWSVNEAHKSLQESIMPLGRVELLYIEKPYRIISDSGKVHEVKGWVLMGQRTKAVNIRSIDSINIFGLRFRPWGVYNLIKIPLNEFTDTITNLSEILPGLALELDGIIEDSEDNFQRYKNLQKCMLKRLADDSPRTKPLIEHTLKTIHVSERFSVSEHTRSLGISHKNLNRTFKKYTGLTIKEYHKILRLRKALTVIDREISMNREVNPNWAEIAISNGFYDQPHFIKEFKIYTGSTPADYLRDTNTPYFNIL